MRSNRRQFRYPLRAISLSQADSRDHPQLQVADLCAGLVNHLYKCTTAGEFDDLGAAARDFGVMDWIFDQVMPTMAVTPEQLGTAEEGGVNPVGRMMADLIRR